MKTLKFLTLMILINFCEPKKTMFLNMKHVNCTTSGIHAKKDIICELIPHPKYPKIYGGTLHATIIQPVYNAQITVTIENKHYTKEFLKIFSYKLDGCGFLNGTVKDAFAQRVLDEITATNKEIKAIIHKCPYEKELKFKVFSEISAMLKSFIKGEYRAHAKLFNDEDKNILTLNILMEGVEI